MDDAILAAILKLQISILPLFTDLLFATFFFVNTVIKLSPLIHENFILHENTVINFILAPNPVTQNFICMSISFKYM
jgi:hypothetical protein